MTLSTEAPIVRSVDRGPVAFINGYQQLAEHGARFYPVHQDKSPAVRGALNRVATLDPLMIRYWAVHCHFRSFAARLPKDCRLIVLDTESPFKHAGRLGPDGEMLLGSILEDSGTTLPPCPTVQTGSGGFHRYLLAPKWFPIRSKVSLWPGIDILAAGSSVILPGSRTKAGEYRALRSFDECPIPEAPRAFVKLIRSAENQCPATTGAPVSRVVTAADDSSVVSRREWYLLFRNRVFSSFWDRRGKLGDTTDSAYEYHLAKACFCCGLNQFQAGSVILRWRRTHGLTRDLRQLRFGIIPRAWAEIEPWVRRWHSEHAAAEKFKKEAKTSNLILRFIQAADQPHTPSSIAAALGIPRERVKKAVQRMSKGGKLLRTSNAYSARLEWGHFDVSLLSYTQNQKSGDCAEAAVMSGASRTTPSFAVQSSQ